MIKKYTAPEEESTPKMIVGLDIGTTKILMVMGFLSDDGKIVVCGHGKAPSTGVKSGGVFNLQETINDITAAKEQLLENISENEDISEVYVGIAGRHVKSLSCINSVTRPGGNDKMVMPEEIQKMTEEMKQMDFSGSDIIAVIPQFYEVDGQATTRPAGTLCQLLVGHYQIVTGDSKEVKKVFSSVRGAGLEPKEPVLEPIASGIVCLTEEEKKAGVALVDIGGGTTDLVIFHGGVPVYSKVIPVGGKIVTHDIESSLNLQFEQAEYLKIHHGTCIPNNANKNNFLTIPDSSGYGNSVKINEVNLAQIIGVRVAEDILKPVKAAIDAAHFSKVVRSVVLTGGGSLLRDIQYLAEFIFQYRTRIGFPVNGLANSTDTSLKNPICSTGLGLLKFGCMAEAVVQEVKKEQPAELVDEDTLLQRLKKKLSIPAKSPSSDSQNGGDNEGAGLFENFMEWVKRNWISPGDGVE
ncbi:MAG: cell division protein FtsA [Bacteroidales bacterium]|nr:cell division protein FtsA [Bacteroidales bacterium]